MKHDRTASRVLSLEEARSLYSRLDKVIEKIRDVQQELDGIASGGKMSRVRMRRASKLTEEALDRLATIGNEIEDTPLVHQENLDDLFEPKT